ncbi:MAG: GIY-YIG nuclease family protein [Candidatus Gracilibacteria bacterium]|nr:GIY-YIG nuclease family protein [Candidatus Gracilibacteria bacterium]
MIQHQIFNIYGFDKLLNEGKIKVIRHADNRIKEFNKILNNTELFNEYQSYQKKDIFKGCKYIISYGEYGKTYGVFKGIYEVLSTENIKEDKVSNELISLGHEAIFTGFLYNLRKLNNFIDLENRLIIDWGKSTIQYHQWFNKENDKKVIEIKNQGYVKDFPGYFDIVLSFEELKKIIDNKESNLIWYNKLSGIYAIYLILDKKTGNQYIGSAYGKDGLWGRWEEYSRTFHGGNKELIELIKNGNSYQLNFQYTILHVLSATKGSDIIYYENLYKEKLGSRTFGLNKN